MGTQFQMKQKTFASKTTLEFCFPGFENLASRCASGGQRVGESCAAATAWLAFTVLLLRERGDGGSFCGSQSTAVTRFSPCSLFTLRALCACCAQTLSTIASLLSIAQLSLGTRALRKRRRRSPEGTMTMTRSWEPPWCEEATKQVEGLVAEAGARRD